MDCALSSRPDASLDREEETDDRVETMMRRDIAAVALRRVGAAWGAFSNPSSQWSPPPPLLLSRSVVSESGGISPDASRNGSKRVRRISTRNVRIERSPRSRSSRRLLDGEPERKEKEKNEKESRENDFLLSPRIRSPNESGVSREVQRKERQRRDETERDEEKDIHMVMSPRSRQLTAHSGSFLERLEMDAERRRINRQKIEQRIAKEEEKHMEKALISKIAQSIPRSVEDLLHWKEEVERNRRKTIENTKKQEMQDCTFQPSTNKKVNEKLFDDEEKITLAERFTRHAEASELRRQRKKKLIERRERLLFRPQIDTLSRAIATNGEISPPGAICSQTFNRLYEDGKRIQTNRERAKEEKEKQEKDYVARLEKKTREQLQRRYDRFVSRKLRSPLSSDDQREGFSSSSSMIFTPFNLYSIQSQDSSLSKDQEENLIKQRTRIANAAITGAAALGATIRSVSKSLKKHINDSNSSSLSLLSVSSP